MANPRAYLDGIGGCEQVGDEDMLKIINKINPKIDAVEVRRQQEQEWQEKVAAYNAQRRRSFSPSDILPPLPITDSRQVRADSDSGDEINTAAPDSLPVVDSDGGQQQDKAPKIDVEAKQDSSPVETPEPDDCADSATTNDSRHVPDPNPSPAHSTDSAAPLTASPPPSSSLDPSRDRDALERSAQEWTTSKSRIRVQTHRGGWVENVVMKYKYDNGLPR